MAKETSITLACIKCGRELKLIGLSCNGTPEGIYTYFIHYSCKNIECPTYEFNIWTPAQQTRQITEDEWIILFENREKIFK